MSARSKHPRPNLHGFPADCRATIQAGTRNIDIVEEIVRHVKSLSPQQAKAMIERQGLTHLTDPGRIAAILDMAKGDSSGESLGSEDSDSSISTAGKTGKMRLGTGMGH